MGLQSIIRTFIPTLSVFLTFAYSIDVTKVQYDLGCTGADTTEIFLTPANVTTAAFGKLFTKPVDGNVYAQPLYLHHFPIGNEVHNLVIVCTENNSIYAFDADSGPAAAYWRRTLAPPQRITSCINIAPTYGITATPVIDRDAGALYVEAATHENGGFYQKLYAINLATGNDLIAPVIIADTVDGTGYGGVEGKIHFDPLLEFCRPGLLLLRDKIYMGMGSHCDAGDYHGWLFSYNASNLTRSSALCLTPNDSEGSVWQCGGGISSDGTHIFCSVGNGSFNPATKALGLSVLKLDGNLSIISSFTPYNFNTLNDSDADLCTSVLLIPGTSLCTVLGKGGCLYLMDQKNLGGNHPSGDSIVQRLDSAYAVDPEGGDPIPVFWNNLLFIWPGNDSVKAFAFNGATFNPFPQASNPLSQGMSAGAITLSANGTSNGILWGTNYADGHLYAFDASHLSTMLWNDAQAPLNRDLLGSPVVKFARPIVASGKVFVPTANSLVVYGLLNKQNISGHPGRSALMGTVKNPRITRHCLYVNLGQTGNFEVVVSDLRGRRVATAQGLSRGGDTRISPPGQNLQPGAYIVSMRVGKQWAAVRAFLTH